MEKIKILILYFIGVKFVLSLELPNSYRAAAGHTAFNLDSLIILLNPSGYQKHACLTSDAHLFEIKPFIFI